MLEPLSCCNNVAGITFVRMKLAGWIGRGRAMELPFIMRPPEVMFSLSSTFFLYTLVVQCGYISIFHYWNIAQCGIYEIKNCSLSPIFPCLQKYISVSKPCSQKKERKEIPIYFLPFISVLTQLRRYFTFSPLRKEVIFWPLTISKINTSKLKTSDLIENCPNIAYFGVMYLLHINISKLIINMNVNLIVLFKLFNFHHLYGFLGVTSTYITY